MNIENSEPAARPGVGTTDCEATPHGDTTEATAGRKAGSSGKLTIAIAIADVVVPIALYYVIRGLGVSELNSLLISSIAPIVSFVVQAVALRKIDGFAIFIGLILLLNIAVALTTADPRTLLARDGWITGLAGLLFLVTLKTKRPVCFSIARPLLEGRLGPPGMDWDTVWETYPKFRRFWTVLTVVWGVGLLIDAAIRVFVAYALPIDWAPGINGVQYFVVYAILQLITNVYLRRSGVLRLPGFEFNLRKPATG